MKYVIFLMMALSAAAYAEVYKWVDADGKVHYGDRPNTGSAREIKIKPAPSTSVRPKDATNNQNAIENWLKARDEERQINKEKAAELKRQKAVQKQKCVRLKTELADLEQGGIAWYDLDESGKRRYYSDKEIAVEIEALKKTIKRQCPR